MERYEQCEERIKKQLEKRKKDQLAAYTTIIHFLEGVIDTFQEAKKKNYSFLDIDEIKQAQLEILVVLNIISELVNKKCATKE